MSDTFEDQLVKKFTVEAEPALPLTHLTDFEVLKTVLNEGSFNPKKPCSVYSGEYILYSFYGRPAYRFPDQETYSVETFSPVCVLLKPELTTKALRILPFDSGGFSFYKRAMHPSFTKARFESKSSTLPMIVVDAFWERNSSYYKHEPRSGLKFSATEDLLLHFYTLITSKLTDTVDDRRGTIEIQLPVPLPTTDNIMALIVPGSVAESFLREQATKLKADVLPYEFQAPFRKNEFHSAIRAVVRSYLTIKGYL